MRRSRLARAPRRSRRPRRATRTRAGPASRSRRPTPDARGSVAAVPTRGSCRRTRRARARARAPPRRQSDRRPTRAADPRIHRRSADQAIAAPRAPLARPAARRAAAGRGMRAHRRPSAPRPAVSAPRRGVRRTESALSLPTRERRPGCSELTRSARPEPAHRGALRCPQDRRRTRPDRARRRVGVPHGAPRAPGHGAPARRSRRSRA